MSSMDKQLHSKIKEPFDEAWKALEALMRDDSEEALSEYMERARMIRVRLSKARTPQERYFLQQLYYAVNGGGGLIRECKRKNGTNKTNYVAIHEDGCNT